MREPSRSQFLKSSRAPHPLALGICGPRLDGPINLVFLVPIRSVLCRPCCYILLELGTEPCSLRPWLQQLLD